MATCHALILFVDIRGFTRWAEGYEVAPYMQELLEGFFASLRTHFPDAFLKPLGDGALLVHEADALFTAPDFEAALAQLLAQTLAQIAATEAAFQQQCQTFAIRYGYKTDLKLGWGVTRGAVDRVEAQGTRRRPATAAPLQDYLGANMNKASRLCASARPFGIILEREDFPTIPSASPYTFTPKDQRLDGMRDAVSVWVTPDIAYGFVPRETRREIPEVHVAGVCIREDQGTLRVLIARRDATRAIHPGKYEGCGGQWAAGESFAAGVQRHFRGEMGIEVIVDTRYHLLYEIREPETPYIPGLRFLCHYQTGEPHSVRHTDLRWVTETELTQLPDDDFVPGIRQEMLTLIREYRAHQPASQ